MESILKLTVDQLKEQVRAGLAKIPATKIISGGMLVNVMSNEIYPADVAIYKNKIVAIGNVEDYKGENTEIIDAQGKYLTPGLIDGHIHSECSKLSITSYAKAVVPRGTTSMISGLDEYISVSGLEGIQEIFSEIEKSPLKLFWGAPYKTPYTLPESTISYNITAQTHKEIQKWPECYGLWETVREFIQEENEDALGAVVEAQNNRLPIFGCSPMATGTALNGYLCAGIRLDHESYSHEEVVEKMRNGMHMIIRESCVTHFLEENIRALTEVNPYFARRMSFCTDDVVASDILTSGHLDNVIRLAIKAGVEPITAIQMATINSAEAYRIDDQIGSISPGRIADILLVDSLEEFSVNTVIVAGEIVARNHTLTIDLKAPTRSKILTDELHCEKVSPADFTYKVDIENGTANVLSMNVIGPFRRVKKEVTLQVKDHEIILDKNQDVQLVSVIERFGKNGNKSLAFCSGWKLKAGAMASSAAPDDNNIVVLGTSAEDMAIAVNHLIEHGGGQVIVKDKEVLDFLPLPVGGICSDAEPAIIAKHEAELKAKARELGCDLPDPLMYMFFLPITAIPDYAITDMGPVDCIGLNIFDPILSLNATK